MDWTKNTAQITDKGSGIDKNVTRFMVERGLIPAAQHTTNLSLKG